MYVLLYTGIHQSMSLSINELPYRIEKVRQKYRQCITSSAPQELDSREQLKQQISAEINERFEKLSTSILSIKIVS